MVVAASVPHWIFVPEYVIFGTCLIVTGVFLEQAYT